MKTRALMSVIVQQPKSFPPLCLSGNGGGARFENPTASETIGPNLLQSHFSQLLIEESEAGGGDRSNQIGHDSSATL
jgi:hypothetical protein